MEGRGRETIETDVSVIGVTTSLWCALLPTQASEVAAQIWEVQLFCCSKFKRAWKVHLYADLTETLYRWDTADSEFNGVIEKWTEPYGLVDICSTIRREGLEFGNMENERYNGSVQS
ncbi:LOW QUALITY PROTEIN: hypothetical protein HID58_021538 [Brassica napus]|uniref:Uncharacterized protein n=1 Tax=Brassica napus TaxID=3708 RepID=A0ABQ8CYW8_BRANA|nr:LOW QUALITY PROTEIN: hypothetical protein HID58_021538 [Brassica napus]